MDSSNWTEKVKHPFYQAGLCLAGAILIPILAKVLEIAGMAGIAERFPWMSAASFMLLFAIFNSISSLTTPDMRKYWGQSIYSFMALAAGAGLFALLLGAFYRRSRFLPLDLRGGHLRLPDISELDGHLA
ncbi:MAG: hypothetical protein R2795_20040 [Saprospiraceae bacterium]